MAQFDLARCELTDCFVEFFLDLFLIELLFLKLLDFGRDEGAVREPTIVSGAPGYAGRGLGLVVRQMGCLPEANEDWREYIQRASEAPDRAIIERYLLSPVEAP